jgi:hypothetical protein
MRLTRPLIVLLLLGLTPARAAFAMGGGHLEDQIADVLVWVVLILAPVIGIGVFLVVHILPEKIAEKRHHPQLDAIKIICLLSLFFGGILWPVAWIWAYSKPTLYKLAYGTDRSVLPQETAPADGELA